MGSSGRWRDDVLRLGVLGAVAAASMAFDVTPFQGQGATLRVSLTGTGADQSVSRAVVLR
jgi:hypothetical protein